MFSAEAGGGLAILEKAACIKVPQVLHYSEAVNNAFLLLGFIKSQEPSGNSWQVFGHRLALLHRKTSPYFGLDHDNYIGSLRQSNKKHQL